MHIAILLIGGNPLPNYVVANYLVKTGRPELDVFPVPDHIILLHSNKTINFAEKLKRLIGNGCDLANLGDDERKAQAIQKTLDDAFKELQTKGTIETIHLNYTGGTKPMAVHSYLKAREFQTTKIFSYLDPESFKITIDDADASYPTSGDLRDQVTVSIEKLFDIHLMKWKSGGSQLSYPAITLDIQQFSQEILKDVGEKDRWDAKIGSKKDLFDREKINRGEKFYTKVQIEKCNDDLFPGITRVFPSLKNVLPKDKFDNTPPQYRQNFTSFLEFLSGKWLEDLILDMLQKLKGEGTIHYTDIQKSVKAEYDRRDCEIDVIVMKGYQMFLFTCTTSKQVKTVKQKAFEALYRADQLGGEHAQVVVVSCLPEKPAPYDQSKENALSILRNDLQSFQAKSLKQCKLIGMDDLENLPQLEQTLIDIIKA